MLKPFAIAVLMLATPFVRAAEPPERTGPAAQGMVPAPVSIPDVRADVMHKLERGERPDTRPWPPMGAQARRLPVPDAPPAPPDPAPTGTAKARAPQTRGPEPIHAPDIVANVRQALERNERPRLSLWGALRERPLGAPAPTSARSPGSASPLPEVATHRTAPEPRAETSKPTAVPPKTPASATPPPTRYEPSIPLPNKVITIGSPEEVQDLADELEAAREASRHGGRPMR